MALDDFFSEEVEGRDEQSRMVWCLISKTWQYINQMNSDVLWNSIAEIAEHGIDGCVDTPEKVMIAMTAMEMLPRVYNMRRRGVLQVVGVDDDVDRCLVAVDDRE